MDDLLHAPHCDQGPNFFSTTCNNIMDLFTKFVYEMEEISVQLMDLG